MPITINGSGSVSGLTPGGLPDGCVVQDDLADGAAAGLKLGTNELSGLCKAWVNFNGTGTVAIRASFNVSSITDNGVGDYTVNFTTAMVDANYSWAINGRNTSGSAQWYGTPPSIAPTAGSLRVQTANGTSYVASDNDYVTVAIFR